MKLNQYIFLLFLLTGFSAISVFASETKKGSLFPDKLLDSDGKEVSSKVLGNKIVGIYFSAQWCPPCRHFTPSLVEFRDQNKKDFEVVFVSSDRSSKDQLACLLYTSDAADE